MDVATRNTDGVIRPGAGGTVVDADEAQEGTRAYVEQRCPGFDRFPKRP